MCTERGRRQARPGTEVSWETTLLMTLHKVEVAISASGGNIVADALRSKKMLTLAPSSPRSMLSPVAMLPVRHPRAAGYRGSDFVPWHRAVVFCAATISVRL
jgi:hypothetical protein